MAMTKTSGSIGVVLVGTELLTGKVEERNLSHLALACGRAGYEIQRVLMVHDHIEVIADAVNQLLTSCEFVVTSGGVGPTHDDVTVDAVARALGVGVQVHPALQSMLVDAGVDAYAAERTARAPEGAALLSAEGNVWPLLQAGRVFMFPGVPSAFRRKLPLFVAKLPQLRQLSLVELYFSADETKLVRALDATVQQYADVRMGSYPVWDDPAYRTRLTFEHLSSDRAEEAAESLLGQLPLDLRSSLVPTPKRST